MYDGFAGTGQFGDIPIGKQGGNADVILGIIHVAQQCLPLDQRRVHHQHDIMGDRSFAFAFLIFPGLDFFINGAEYKMYLIRGGGEIADFFVIAPHMGHIFEHLKPVGLLGRHNENQLGFIVRMQGNDIKDDGFQQGIQVFLIADQADGLAAAQVQSHGYIRQYTVFLNQLARQHTQFIRVQLEADFGDFDFQFGRTAADSQAHPQKVFILDRALPQTQSVNLIIQHSTEGFRGRIQGLVQQLDSMALFFSQDLVNLLNIGCIACFPVCGLGGQPLLLIIAQQSRPKQRTQQHTHGHHTAGHHRGGASTIEGIGNRDTNANQHNHRHGQTGANGQNKRCFIHGRRRRRAINFDFLGFQGAGNAGSADKIGFFFFRLFWSLERPVVDFRQGGFDA